MSNFIQGVTFADSGTAASLTAARLHQLVTEAEANPEFITGKTAITVTASGDRVMVSDASDSNTLKSVTLANLLPSASVRAANIYTSEEFTFSSLRLQNPAGGSIHGWQWSPGNSSNLVLQETTSAGAALIPYKIPIQVIEGAQNNTLFLNSTGLGVLNYSPAEALDVTGRIRASGTVYCRNAAPTLALVDTDDATTGAVVAFDVAGPALYFGNCNSSFVLQKYPFVLNTGADNNTLVVSSASKVGIGNASPAYTFDVTGDVHLTGSLYLDEGTAPANASATGTKGEVRWNTTAGYIYICVATNTWKRAAIATW